MTRKRRPTTINYLSVAALMRALLDGPATVKDLMHESGLSACTCRRYVNALRKARVIHVKLWDVDSYGKRSLASYAIGDKDDAPRAASNILKVGATAASAAPQPTTSRPSVMQKRGPYSSASLPPISMKQANTSAPKLSIPPSWFSLTGKGVPCEQHSFSTS